MFWTVIKKEIASNLLSYKFFIVILLAAILIFTSFFIMYRDYKGRLADYQLIKPKPDEPIAVNPPNPLSIFVKGLDDAMSRSFEIGVSEMEVRAGQESGNIIFSFFPAPDFLYVVRVIMSLVALLFGFDQVGREKERGTLKLMLSNPLSRAKVLLGKSAGNFLSLAVPFLIITVLGFVLLNADRDIRFSSGHLARLAVILGISLIYIALFLSLGILISTLTKSSAASIVILLFIWAVLVFVIPNIGTLLARQMVDVPSVETLTRMRDQIWAREILLGQNEEQRSLATWEAHYRTSYGDMEKLEEDYRNKFRRLIRLSKNVNRISPVASLIYAVTDIAGTGIGEEDNLKKEITQYKNAIYPDVFKARFNRTEVQHSPFAYHYRSLPEIFSQGALFDTAWLVFFNILFFALSYFAFVRYDVR